MPTTILLSLTRPNPKVYNYGPPGNLTIGPRWVPVEGIRQWEDFTYSILAARFKTELKKSVSSWDPSDHIKRCHFNEVVNEDSVEAFLTTNCMLPIGSALYEVDKTLCMGAASKFARPDGTGLPDWGCGHTSREPSSRHNFCPGDIKGSSKWNSNLLYDVDWENYQNEPDWINIARPLEQVQHYCTYLGTRYGWILTDRELVVMRVTNSTDDEPSSPRQLRSSAGQGRAGYVAHQRVVSNTSNLSSAFSAMSVDHSAYSGRSGSSAGNNLAPLEIVCVPMSASGTKGLTVNLALFFLALLARGDCAISSSYPPLGPGVTSLGKSGAKESLGKSASKVSSRKSTKTSSKASQKKHASGKSHDSQHTPATTFFLEAAGIDWAVIEADIELYLPGASVKTGPQRNGVDGYYITAQATTEDLRDLIPNLQHTTMRWAQENGKIGGTGLYIHSETYLNCQGTVEEEDSGEEGDDHDSDYYYRKDD